MPKKYKPRIGPDAVLAEGYRNLRITCQQMGQTILQLFAERDAALAALALVLKLKEKQDGDF